MIKPYLLDELDDWVGQQLRSCVTELLQCDEAGVGVAKNTMTVSARNEGISIHVRKLHAK